MYVYLIQAPAQSIWAWRRRYILDTDHCFYNGLSFKLLASDFAPRCVVLRCRIAPVAVSKNLFPTLSPINNEEITYFHSYINEGIYCRYPPLPPTGQFFETEADKLQHSKNKYVPQYAWTSNLHIDAGSRGFLYGLMCFYATVLQLG